MMGLEIEKKFKIKPTILNRLHELPKAIIRQGYLTKVPERTVRVRIKGNKGYLTVKGITKGIVRKEFEYEIPLEEAIDLLGLCEPYIIEKTRYTFFENNLEWELDVFEGNNSGLVIVEVELPTENHPIELPDWIEEEVSDDPRYYNSYLSEKPFCEWKRT